MKAETWHGIGDIGLCEVPHPAVREPLGPIVKIITSGVREGFDRRKPDRPKIFPAT